MTHETEGVLYLIPSSLGEDSLDSVWPAAHTSLINNLDIFIVENLRTARRFLRRAGLKKDFDQLRLHLVDKHHPEQDLLPVLDELANGQSIGLLSEAGCPGVADPGQELVAYAHRRRYRVKPLVGPSSILLALMASGLNGQHFSFHGYLPIDQAVREKKIKRLEADSQRSAITQIFMEAPYRNNALAKSVLSCCQDNTLFSIAMNISKLNEYISTKTIGQWKREGLPDLHKRPAIFLLMGS